MLLKTLSGDQMTYQQLLFCQESAMFVFQLIGILTVQWSTPLSQSTALEWGVVYWWTFSIQIIRKEITCAYYGVNLPKSLCCRFSRSHISLFCVNVSQCNRIMIILGEKGYVLSASSDLLECSQCCYKHWHFLLVIKSDIADFDEICITCFTFH